MKKNIKTKTRKYKYKFQSHSEFYYDKVTDGIQAFLSFSLIPLYYKKVTDYYLIDDRLMIRYKTGLNIAHFCMFLEIL